MIYFINFLFAFSTSISMTIIPLLATESIGLSLLVLGMIEGGSEFLSNLFKLISGNFFDKTKDIKKIFKICGLLSFTSKIILLFFGGIFILCSKILERMANGIFAAPRDAYAVKFTQNKARALGFLTLSKTMGCVFGAFFVAFISQFYYVIDFLKEIALVAAATAFSAFACSYFVKNHQYENTESVFNFDLIKEVYKKTGYILIISFLFFLSRFNDGMLILYLKDLGFSETFYTSTIGIFNGVMFAFTGIFLKLMNSKRINLGLFLTVCSMLVFNVTFLLLQKDHIIQACCGLILWGIQRCGATLIFAYMIFSAVEKSMYGTAIGLYFFLTGIASFIAAGVFGVLAEYHYYYAYIYNLGIIFLCLFALKRFNLNKV